MRTVTTVITDDITSEPGAETISFAYKGQAWEIDLTPESDAQLAAALDPFILRARRLRRGVNTVSALAVRTVKPERSFDIVQLRAWASAHDVALPQRGRIPQAIVEQYEAWANAPRKSKAKASAE